DVPRNGAVLSAAGVCPAGPRGSDMMVAALAKKQADDKAAMDIEVAALAAKAAAERAAAEAEAQRQAALKERGSAIGDFVGGIFGGSDSGVAKVIDPTLVAPMPAPRIERI